MGTHLRVIITVALAGNTFNYSENYWESLRHFNQLINCAWSPPSLDVFPCRCTSMASPAPWKAVNRCLHTVNTIMCLGHAQVSLQGAL